MRSTRLVGGAVRDLALGEPAVDFDLTTTATTDEVIRRARKAGFKVALTGVAHGTVTIVIDGRPIETTTLREDVETDGRWAKVTFGRDFATDARRRDFTINALSLSADGIVNDYVAARGPRPSEKTHAENSGWPRSTAETTRPLPHNCRGHSSTCPRNSSKRKPPGRANSGARPRRYEPLFLPRDRQKACHVR